MKRIYFRILASGKLSFGEYVRAKWINICEPFKSTDEVALSRLLEELKIYKKKTAREIEFVPYRSIDNTHAVVEWLRQQMK